MLTFHVIPVYSTLPVLIKRVKDHHPERKHVCATGT